MDPMRDRSVTRRSFLETAGTTLLVFAGSNAARAQARPAYDVCEKSIAELQAAMAAGQVTSAQLVELYLNRIAAYDQAGPRLNCVLHVNSRARAEARALDEERRRRGPRGPLHGIPALLKDNFDTRDMPTTGGCLALAGATPKQDAFQVAKLRQAGVVILGKVNLHELALGLTTVSSLGGQSLNPYDLTRAPGGSSGGSGVAAAANFAAFTLGTDTSGSIRIPSSHNSLVGLRPSAGLSSRAGIIPFGHTQDSGGPMARTVADVAAVLDATVGFDQADPTTGGGRDRIPRTYAEALRPQALNGARIGMFEELFGMSAEDMEVGSIVRRAVEDMKAQGATAVTVTVPDLGRQLMVSNLLTQELKFYLGDYLKNAPGSAVKSVEELLASGLHTAQFQAFVEAANSQPDNYLTSEDYKGRLAARSALTAAVLQVMDEQRLDALVYPTARRIAPTIGGNQLGSNAGLSAQTGLPAITVPAGFTAGGFPVGLEMLGRAFAESTLLGLAFAYEQKTRHRRPPASAPPLSTTSVRLVPSPSSDAGPGSVSFSASATGRQAVPPSAVPFGASARFSYNAATRQLGYDVTVSGDTKSAAGIYLHRRAARPNGGVAHILGKTPGAKAIGSITLTEAEAADLTGGKLYLSVVSRRTPRLSARADLTLPSK
jgi:amidase